MLQNHFTQIKDSQFVIPEESDANTKNNLKAGRKVNNDVTFRANNISKLKINPTIIPVSTAGIFL